MFAKKLPAFIALITLFTFPNGSALAQSQNEKGIQYDAMLSAYKYPFDVHSYNFESQGKALKMAYMYLPATSADKATITLIHGKNFNGAYWEKTANFLHNLGYGVIIPDQIGFGKSSKPTDYQYSFAAFAHNTQGLISSLGINKTIVIGHSMGGMTASRLALSYPEKVEKLILVNPIGLENYLQFVEYKDIGFFYNNEKNKTAEKIIAYQQKNYYDGQWNDDYETLAQPLIGWVNGPDWDKLAYVSALTYDIIFTQPVIEEFKDLSVPTTLILGTRDRTGPGRNWKKENVTRELGRFDLLGAEVQKRNPSITLVELEGLGHLPQEEDFPRFKATLSDVLN